MNYYDPEGLLQADPSTDINSGQCLAIYVDGVFWGCAGGGSAGAADGSGGGPVCLLDKLGFLPNPACQTMPPPPPQPEPALMPLECDTTLYYRSVNNLIAQLANGTHSYWQVQIFDPNSGTKLVDQVISGGQHAVTDPSTGKNTTYLKIWVHSSYEGLDQPEGGEWWFTSGLNASNCDGVARMLQAAARWKNDFTRYGYQNAPNSNTIARMIGMNGGFFPSAPPGSFGW